jgi:SH3-like domain-containing protein
MKEVESLRAAAKGGLLARFTPLVSGCPKASWCRLPAQESGGAWLAEAMAVALWAAYPEAARFDFPGVLS